MFAILHALGMGLRVGEADTLTTRGPGSLRVCRSIIREFNNEMTTGECDAGVVSGMTEPIVILKARRGATCFYLGALRVPWVQAGQLIARLAHLVPCRVSSHTAAQAAAKV